MIFPFLLYTLLIATMLPMSVMSATLEITLAMELGNKKVNWIKI